MQKFDLSHAFSAKTAIEMKQKEIQILHKGKNNFLGIILPNNGVYHTAVV